MPVIPDDQLSPYGRDAKRAAQKPSNRSDGTTSPHQRYGDRGSSEPAAPAPLRVWVRFRDLRRAGVVTNWPTLLRLIADEDFPVGRYIGPNTRVWAADEIEAWLESRPAGSRR